MGIEGFRLIVTASRDMSRRKFDEDACRVLPFDDDGNVPTVDGFPLDQDTALNRLIFFRIVGALSVDPSTFVRPSILIPTFLTYVPSNVRSSSPSNRTEPQFSGPFGVE